MRQLAVVAATTLPLEEEVRWGRGSGGKKQVYTEGQPGTKKSCSDDLKGPHLYSSNCSTILCLY